MTAEERWAVLTDCWNGRDVARVLREEGVTGYRNDPFQNPVANWLAGDKNVFSVYLDYWQCEWEEEMDDHHYHDVPEAVVEFLDAFNSHRGHYPELEDLG